MSELLIVVNDPRYFISHRLPIANAARDSGYVVRVASIPSPIGQKIKDLGFEYYELPMVRGGINPLYEVYSVFRFWQLLWKLRPDILHLVTLKPVLYGGVAARFAPVGGVVGAIAGMGSVFITKGIKYTLMRLAMRGMFRLALGKRNLRAVFQNLDDRDAVIALSSIPVSKTVMVRGSGVDVSKYKVLPEPVGVVVVTFAGRLLRDKGVVEFVEAARLLRGEGVNAIFQLAGDADPGNPSSLSGKELDRLRADGDVLVMGYREDINELFSASHIVVLPSYREGLPKVLIEAAASGRAVVTSDVPGCRDAIDPGVSGLLVPVRDPAALAQAIGKLICDPALREQFGRRGRELAEREFTIEKVVQAHLDTYEALRVGGNRTAH